MSDNHLCNRREVLKNAVMAASVIGFSDCLLKAESMAKPKPSTRPSWTLACRDSHLRHVGELDTWSAMKAIKADGVEVMVTIDGKCTELFAPNINYTIADRDGVKRLRDDAGRNGKRITAFCIANQFDRRPNEEVAATVKCAKVAAELGTPAIRLDLVPQKLSEQEFLPFAIQIGQRLVKETRDLNVNFAVENHGHNTNKVEFLKALFEGVGSNRFGLTLDTGNFYWYGTPLDKIYDVYATFASRAFHTHCKTIHYPESERNKQRPIGWEYGKYTCPLYEGDLDFKRIVAILAKGGYTNDLCIEDESLGNLPPERCREVLAKEVQFLRDILENRA